MCLTGRLTELSVCNSVVPLPTDKNLRILPTQTVKKIAYSLSAINRHLF